MLGRKERDQLELFISGSLRQLVPDDHILARVDRVLDLAWLRDEVADLYCADNGRPGIDPEAAVRLMLAGFLRDCQESCVRGHSDADGGRLWRSRKTRWTSFWTAVTRKRFSTRTGFSTS